MPITIYLEIAIGVIFIWMILSVGVSAILEWIAGIFRWRANDLMNGIRNMLEKEHPRGKAPSLTRALYNHPIIQSLSISNKKLPSYIPSKSFALTLLDILMTAGTQDSILKSWQAELEAIENPQLRILFIEEGIHELARIAKSNLGQKNKEQLTNVLYASREPIYRALQKRFPKEKEALQDLFSRFFTREALENLVERLLSSSQYELLSAGAARFVVNSPKLMDTMDGLIMDAQGIISVGEIKLKEFRTSIESWFNNAMDRLSGYYKRRAQLFTFLIGLILAAFLNIDSIAIVRTLWQEPTTRSAIVAEAQALEALPEEDPSVPETLDRIDEKLKALSLPVGWNKLNSAECRNVRKDPDAWQAACVITAETYPLGMPTGVLFWLEKVLGFLLSGAAAAQGAPFWFDIMKKLINLRSAGIKPDED